MSGRVLMIQGTASSVGKSLLTAALCRIYARRGYRVAPFKSQNMSLNSFVTADGAEIGRAQAVQAEAAGCEPSVHMNPILLKPEGHRQCQVVVRGKVYGGMGAGEYHAHKPELGRTIAESLAALRTENDVVFIEGAGSPAEVNLKERDIANMFVAALADAPVLLVGDIDRGGVFASLVGTMELLTPDERARVAGFVFNKFRGDPTLLGNGLEFLRERTGVPVLAVVPHVDELRIAEEDATALDERVVGSDDHPEPGTRSVAVLRLPHISNYDDILPLEREPGLSVRFTRSWRDVARADLVVIPGSKCTVEDLAWVRQRGLHLALRRRAEEGRPILGICGGCQMLGNRIEDPEHFESDVASVAGLGLLPITTIFRTSKTTAQVSARAQAPSFLATPGDIVGYEIHAGDIVHDNHASAPFRIAQRNGAAVDRAEGAVSADGVVVGTMIHGILDNAAVRASLLSQLGTRSGSAQTDATEDRMREYDRLADVVEDAFDMQALDAIIGVRVGDG